MTLRRPEGGKKAIVLRAVLFASLFALSACAAAPETPSADLRPLAKITSVTAVQADDYMVISVEGVAPTPGYTELTLRPVNYIQKPPDGMYDFTAVGKPPGGMVAQVTSPVMFRYRWHGVGVDVQGVRVHAGDSVIEAKLTGR